MLGFPKKVKIDPKQNTNNFFSKFSKCTKANKNILISKIHGEAHN